MRANATIASTRVGLRSPNPRAMLKDANLRAFTVLQYLAVVVAAVGQLALRARFVDEH